MGQSAPAPLRCLVLGATGFIGGQVARAAVERGWRVRGLRRRPDAEGAVGDLPIEWVSGDLADVVSLVTAMRGCPLVFHCAGYYPYRGHNIQETVRHGVTGMRHVLTAAATARVKRLIYTSALTTVGPPSEPGRMANESDLYTPGSVASPYFEVKWAMEMEALRAAVQGLRIVIVMPTLTVGPGDVKPVTGALLLMAARGRIPGYVEGSINVVDGRDVGAGHIAAAERGRPGRRYILGGHNVSFREMLAAMAEASGRRAPRSRIPQWLIRLISETDFLPGVPGTHHLRTIRQWQPLDTTRAKEELKLPDPIPFEQTCHDGLAWFHAHGHLRDYPALHAGEEARS